MKKQNGHAELTKWITEKNTENPKHFYLISCSLKFIVGGSCDNECWLFLSILAFISFETLAALKAMSNLELANSFIIMGKLM